MNNSTYYFILGFLCAQFGDDAVALCNALTTITENMEKFLKGGGETEALMKIAEDWDTETILKYSDSLLKCGFTNDDIAKLLSNRPCDEEGYGSDKYLDIICKSEYLYDFITEHSYNYYPYNSIDDDEKLPFDSAMLRYHGASEEVIKEWIKDHYDMDDGDWHSGFDYWLEVWG